ncbi:MAG: G5 domain-containing protein [Chthonomonadales bacterium]|nr:G5 domain-containing protein [Chthonomonadales bacterium]
MSIPGSAPGRFGVAAIVAAGLMALSPVLQGAPATRSSNTSRSDAPTTTRKIEQREPIPYPTLRRSSSELRDGTSKTVRSGVKGIKKVIYRVTYKDKEEIRREKLSSKVLKHPRPEVIAYGRRGKLASRGYFSGRNVLTMIATGYDPSPASNGGYSRTATGLRVGHGVVAVDPKFIPLGTRLYIEGYGYAVAADTGRAIKGNRIDLGHDTRQGAANVGRRKVIVHILD